MALKLEIKANQTQLKNIEKKLEMLREYPEDAGRVIKHTSEQAVGRMKSYATEMGAVDTGRLRRNIEWEPKGDFGANITSEAIDPTTGRDYAPTVHYGLARSGRNSVPRPYFQRGVQWLVSELNKRLREAIKKIIK